MPKKKGPSLEQNFRNRIYRNTRQESRKANRARQKKRTMRGSLYSSKHGLLSVRPGFLTRMIYAAKALRLLTGPALCLPLPLPLLIASSEHSGCTWNSSAFLLCTVALSMKFRHREAREDADFHGWMEMITLHLLFSGLPIIKSLCS